MSLGLLLILIAAAADTGSLKVTSSAFADGGAIPKQFTCQGEDVSPELRWSGTPASAKSIVIIVDDPDAPDPAAPAKTWVHWVLYNLPPQAITLSEGVTKPGLPPGTREGVNDFEKTGYAGPCPPIGKHRYFFKVYALDTKLGDLGTPTKAQIEQAMKEHIVAKGELVGTYKKE